MLFLVEAMAPGTKPPLKQEALIHWVEEARHDRWPATQVPAGMRYEGGLGHMKWKDGGNYLGKIVKMSGECIFILLSCSAGFQLFFLDCHNLNGNG